MAKRGYPFKKSDVKFGENLLSSLFAIPRAIFSSSSRSDDSCDLDWGPVKFNKVKHIIGNIIMGVCALLCPIVGLFTYLFCDWWMFFSVFLLSWLELYLFWYRQFNVEVRLSNYIFDKDNLDAQIKTCRKTIIFNNWLSVILTMLNTYPLVLAVFYWCDFDLGPILELGPTFKNGVSYKKTLFEWEPNDAVLVLWSMLWLARCVFCFLALRNKSLLEDSLAENSSIK